MMKRLDRERNIIFIRDRGFERAAIVFSSSLLPNNQLLEWITQEELRELQTYIMKINPATCINKNHHILLHSKYRTFTC